MNFPVPSIPPHIRWPLFVITLLLISIAASSYTLFMAQSDGGAAVVENYYTKAKAWDQTARAQTAGNALNIDLQIGEAKGENHMRMLEVVVRDSSGTPVSLSGMIRGRRPQLAAPVASVPLQPVEGQPGTYRQMLPVRERGIWDFEIDATRGTTAIQKTIRRTL